MVFVHYLQVFPSLWLRLTLSFLKISLISLSLKNIFLLCFFIRLLAAIYLPYCIRCLLVFLCCFKLVFISSGLPVCKLATVRFSFIPQYLLKLQLPQTSSVALLCILVLVAGRELF